MTARRSFLFVAAAAILASTSRMVSAGSPLRPSVLRAFVGPVPKGGEKQLCHPFTFPGDEPTEVGRVQIRVHGESHHVHLYRSVGAPEYPPFECPYAVNFSHWALVAATQTKTLDWRLHRGVSIAFEPGEPLLVQTHFNNDGSKRGTVGNAKAKITLHPVSPAKVRAHGGALFAQDRAVLVPPGRTTVASRCALTGQGTGARDLTIMALTGHYHYRGVEFQVYRVNTDGSLGELLYEHQGYEDPPFKQYPARKPLVLRAGEGIEWRCTYENPGPETYEFGPNTLKNEHCNLFGFYYPADSPQETIDCVHYRDGRTERIVAK